MSVVSVKMKTHSREEVTGNRLNDCIVHHCQPKLFKMVVGSRKETMYVINCIDDACGKIHYFERDVVWIWNKFNLLPSPPKQDK